MSRIPYEDPDWFHRATWRQGPSPGFPVRETSPSLAATAAANGLDVESVPPSQRALTAEERDAIRRDGPLKAMIMAGWEGWAHLKRAQAALGR